MKTCNCDLLEEKSVMQAAGGQIEFQGWKAVLVLVVQILLRIVACLVGIPVLVLKLCTDDKVRETSSSETCCDCHCCVVRCLLLEEGTTSYINPLFGQDWSSETYCNEQALLAEKMVVVRTDEEVGQCLQERQLVSDRRKTVLPVRALPKKKPPPKPQRAWR